RGRLALAAPDLGAAKPGHPGSGPPAASSLLSPQPSVLSPLSAPAVVRQSQALIAGWEAEPGAFDNDIDRGAVTRTLLHNLYDRLGERDMTVKSNQPIVPNLAAEWTTSADARIYTFKLRQGVRFHDGTELDAEAVKFNIDRVFDPSHPFYHQAGAGSLKLGYGNLDRVEAVDKY